MQLWSICLVTCILKKIQKDCNKTDPETYKMFRWKACRLYIYSYIYIGTSGGHQIIGRTQLSDVTLFHTLQTWICEICICCSVVCCLIKNAAVFYVISQNSLTAQCHNLHKYQWFSLGTLVFPTISLCIASGKFCASYSTVPIAHMICIATNTEPSISRVIAQGIICILRLFYVNLMTKMQWLFCVQLFRGTE